jgi:hypothetical protein
MSHNNEVQVTENQRHSDENIPPADGYRRKKIVSTLDLGNWKSQLGLADEPKREFKPGDKIRVNLHHGKIEDAALLLSDGHAPRHIANTLGVTENIVRSQIKSIYSNTGVKRQGELIRLLLSERYRINSLIDGRPRRGDQSGRLARGRAQTSGSS